MSSYMSAPSVRKKSFARNSRMCIPEQRDDITMSSPEVLWPVPMRAIGAQNLLTMPGGVSMAGYLHKKGGNQFSLRKWPLRYTILHKGCVYYFKSSTSAAPQGAFSLNGYNRVMRAAEETTSSNVFPFKIVHFSKNHRTWFFSAASEKERRKWMQYLRREIDRYNDRKECNIPSCSDSDEDSFYGTIERPMDIKNPVDTDDEYCEEDEEEEEEDYVKPDSDCSPTSTGHPIGPPPSYPPPPVPAASQQHHNFSPVSNKAPPAPTPPLHRNPTSPLPRKPQPALPPPTIPKERPRGLPPPVPYAPHPQKLLYSTPPPPPPPPNLKPVKGIWPSTEGCDKTEWRSPPAPMGQSASALPICNHLETSMSLNGPTFSPSNAGGGQSLDSYHKGVMGTHRIRPYQAPLHSTNTEVSSHRLEASDSLSPSQIPVSHLPPRSPPQGLPQIKTGPCNKPEIPKPPLASAKPQLTATKFKQPGAPPQRSSPDGQSLRSLGGKMPFEHTRKPKLGQYRGGHDSDDDYENMQLPDSVFIDTTETSVVERLFRQGFFPPQDGLYGIRNSGTKTSQVLVVWDVSISRARNYRLFEEDGLIFLDSEVTFPDLAALIEHYYSHPLPHHGSLCLQKPYINLLST